MLVSHSLDQTMQIAPRILSLAQTLANTDHASDLKLPIVLCHFKLFASLCRHNQRRIILRMPLNHLHFPDFTRGDVSHYESML